MKSSKARYRNLSANVALPEVHEGQFARAMIFAIVTAIFTLLGWSAVTPVNEITTGTGTITTTEKPEQVEHPDGGIVAEILVRAGDHVKADSVLMTFDTSSLRREMNKLRATQIALAAERGRIDFVLGGTGQVPAFSDLADLSAEELLFWAEQSYLEAQLDLIESESAAVRPAIATLKARQASMNRELTLLRDRLARTRKGQASGAISLNAVTGIERDYLQIERASLELEGDIAAQQSILKTNELRKSELLARRVHEAALRRAEIDELIITTDQSMAEIRARIDRATVRASVSGTVMALTIANPQEVVGPGELIAEIIPTRDRVEADIEISAGRIGAVEIGMPARLKVLSYDFTRYGEIEGDVSAISPSSFVNEQGETVYRVTITLPEEGRDARLANRPILPGMTVTADILSDSKKVLTYLLKPLRALGDRAFTEA